MYSRSQLVRQPCVLRWEEILTKKPLGRQEIDGLYQDRYIIQVFQKNRLLYRYILSEITIPTVRNQIVNTNLSVSVVSHHVLVSDQWSLNRNLCRRSNLYFSIFLDVISPQCSSQFAASALNISSLQIY